MTSSTFPSGEWSDTVVWDSFGSNFVARFVIVALTLGAASGFSGCSSLRVLVPWFYFSCASADISTFMPLGDGCWVSSTTSVGFIGVVSGDGILSILMISDGCCLISCDCTCSLVLNLECQAVWVDSSCFGGAMVVNVDHSLSSVDSATSVNFSLCSVCTLALCFFSSLPINCFLLLPWFVWIQWTFNSFILSITPLFHL
jgi:hypothetical protein